MKPNTTLRSVFELDSEISTLITQSPSVFGNSILVFPVFVCTLIIGLISTLGGIGMIIDSQFRAEYFDDWMQNLFDHSPSADQITSDLMLYSGLGAIAVGILFLFITILIRMILRRNGNMRLLRARKDELNSLKEAEEKIAMEYTE